MRKTGTRKDGAVVVGLLGRGSTTLHCTHHVLTHRLKDPSLFFFPPSLALWLARRPLQPGMLPWAWLAGHSPVVRGVLCEGDEGIAEVREQHRYPPSASAVRECSGNCRVRWSSPSEIMQIVTSAARAIYLACVQCRGTLHRAVLHPGVPVKWQTHIRDLSPTAESCKGSRLSQGNKLPWLIVCTGVWAVNSSAPICRSEHPCDRKMCKACTGSYNGTCFRSGTAW